MRAPTSRRWFLISASASTACLGCGTLMYPERRGQVSGMIDWRVAALDGLGLLLFFVPGVIAFAVDFYTGAIYLPPHYPPAGPWGAQGPVGGPALAPIPVGHAQLRPENLEQTVSQYAGRPIELTEGRYQTQPLDNINQFWPTAHSMNAESAAMAPAANGR